MKHSNFEKQKEASEVRAQNKLQMANLFKMFKMPKDSHLVLFASLDGRREQGPFFIHI